MTFRILVTLDAGKPTEQLGWARDADEGVILEFSDYASAETKAVALHTDRPSSRITFAVEEMK